MQFKEKMIQCRQQVLHCAMAGGTFSKGEDPGDLRTPAQQLYCITEILPLIRSLALPHHPPAVDD